MYAQSQLQRSLLVHATEVFCWNLLVVLEQWATTLRIETRSNRLLQVVMICRKALSTRNVSRSQHSLWDLL